VKKYHLTTQPNRFFDFFSSPANGKTIPQALFFTQHYILYPEPPADKRFEVPASADGVPSTIVKASDTLVLNMNSFDDGELTDGDSYIETDDNESLQGAQH